MGNSLGKITVVLGLQRGDEGKGRFVDMLAGDHQVIARFNGGPNAGHSVTNGQVELKLHQLPSGILYEDNLNVVGNGMLLDPLRLQDEITEVSAAGVKISPKNLLISNQAHLILPHHVALDEVREAGAGGQGSTKRGIAFAAADKYERIGVRAEDIAVGEAVKDEALAKLQAVMQANPGVEFANPDAEAYVAKWWKAAQALAPFLRDTVEAVHDALAAGKNVLAEGAQAFGIDIEHGMYPYVTSSHTTTGGVLNGLGVGANRIGRVVGVAKAVKSHVGGGPFVTEMLDEATATQWRGPKGKIDSEYGSTTGRPRRIGFFDLPELRQAIRVNGVTELALTKLDVLSEFGKDKITVCVAYDDGSGNQLSHAPSSGTRLAACKPVYKEFPLWTEPLRDVREFSALPQAAQDFITMLESELAVPINMIGVGPERDQVIVK